MLRPGMSGSVDIYTQTVSGTVAVPIQAVTVRDFNRKNGDGENGSRSRGEDSNLEALQPEEDLRRVVFVAEADTARMVEVETGISDDTHVAVLSGLDGGERVIIGPYSAVSRELNEGDRVRIDSEESASDRGSSEFASAN